jgi:selenocysteine lyase/cysteine desulfurase
VSLMGGAGSEDFRSFFDWASTSPLLEACFNAQSHYLDTVAARRNPPGDLNRDTGTVCLAARKAVGRVLRAPDREVVLLRSVAEGVSLIAGGLSPAGSVIVLSRDHQACFVPWVRFGWAMTAVDGGVDELVAAVKHVDDRVPLVVCVAHVDHLDGEVREFGALRHALDSRRRAGLLVVDGAQAVGRIDVAEAACVADAYLGAARKALLGPVGAGFMQVRPSVLEGIQPLCISTLNSEESTYGSISLRPGARRLEGALPDLGALCGLEAALDEFVKHEQLTCQQIAQRSHALQDALSSYGVKVLASRPSPCGIHRIALGTGVDHKHVSMSLREVGIEVAPGDGWLRLSVHRYNDDAALLDLSSRLAAWSRP